MSPAKWAGPFERAKFQPGFIWRNSRGKRAGDFWREM